MSKTWSDESNFTVSPLYELYWVLYVTIHFILLSSLINEQYPAPTSKKNIKNYIW